jgi:hypothetical protein
MVTFIPKMKTAALLAVLVPAFIACGVNSSSNGNSTGRLSLSLTDKPTNTVTDVYITIKEIDVHAANDAEGSWTPILDLNQTYKITDFTNGMRKQLGIVNLDPGHYTQMRLIIGTVPTGDNQYANWVVDESGSHQLKIPSGAQTGIKFVQGFDINENSTTELTFDFDAYRSIVVAGNSGKYLLKPVIHMIDDSQTRLVIKGIVKDTSDALVSGGNVSLQLYNPLAADPKDQITVPYSTMTDSTGAYLFFFLDVPDPTTFNLVATDWTSADPLYGAAWDQIADAVNGGSYQMDFWLPVLNPATDVGTVNITVSGAATDETPVTLSFRQMTTLPGDPAPVVEVRTINYTNGSYTLDLPVGDYTVVAWTEGKTTLVLPATPPLTVTVAGPNNLDVKFL